MLVQWLMFKKLEKNISNTKTNKPNVYNKQAKTEIQKKKENNSNKTTRRTTTTTTAKAKMRDRSSNSNSSY